MKKESRYRYLRRLQDIQLIELYLEKYNGNVSEIAAMFEMTPDNLYQKMRKLNIPLPNSEEDTPNVK